MADISKITLPDGVTYDIKDATARAAAKAGLVIKVVDTLPTASADTMGALYLVKKTGSGTDTHDEYVTVKNGTTYSWEFIGTTQVDLSNYSTKGHHHTYDKTDDVQTSGTPLGSVSQPTFSGTTATITSSGKFTPAGTVGSPAISIKTSEGSETELWSMSSSGSYSASSYTAEKVTLPTYVAGSCTMPSYTKESVTMPTYTAASLTLPTYTAAELTLPTYTAGSCKMPSYTKESVTLPTFTYSDETLTITEGGYTESKWTAGSYTAPTWTDGSYTAAVWKAGSYTAAVWKAGSYTQSSWTAGSYSAPTWTAGSYTASSYTKESVSLPGRTHVYLSASAPSFSGTEGSVSVSASYTPAGTVSKPTFTGSNTVFNLEDMYFETANTSAAIE